VVPETKFSTGRLHGLQLRQQPNFRWNGTLDGEVIPQTERMCENSDDEISTTPSSHISKIVLHPHDIDVCTRADHSRPPYAICS
jgi:hypothetical protein